MKRITKGLGKLWSRHIIPANYPKIGLAFWILSWFWAFRGLSGFSFDLVLLSPAVYFPYFTYLYFLSMNRRLAVLLAMSRAAVILIVLGLLYIYLL